MKKITDFIRKHIKKLGGLLMITALVFIVRKIISMDVDYSVIFSGKTALFTVLCILIQTGIIIFMCSPWLRLTEILSSKKIPYGKALSVYTKSNFLKYVPGNVFQYIGRNQLASDAGISHADVAGATVIDIVFSMAAPFFLGLALTGSGAAKLIRAYGKNFVIAGAAGIAVTALAVIICFKFRSRLSSATEKYRKIFIKENIKRILFTFIYYIFQNGITVLMCMLALKYITGINQPTQELLMISGVYLFSWIVGFITPGAPGGIGVREAVMMLMCGDMAAQDDIMLFVVVMRVVSTAADALAFLCGIPAGRKERDTNINEK